MQEFKYGLLRQPFSCSTNGAGYFKKDIEYYYNKNGYFEEANIVIGNYSIWIEAEEWAEENMNKEDENTDVIVKFNEGGKWIATFITYQNIFSLSGKNEKTGECLKGKYF